LNQISAKELNSANNSKEEFCQRFAAAEIPYAENEVEVGRLYREIDASAFAFNDNVVVEVIVANVAFNEKLAMQALELATHFDRKLDVELEAEKVFAIEQHSAELEVLRYEHKLKLFAERDKY